MNRISQKDIIKAIQQIKLTPELRKGRASSTYDLIFEGIAYPPKLVISIANEYATGKELDPSDFEGGVGTPAFKLLKKEGFKIIAKEQHIIESLRSKKIIGACLDVLDIESSNFNINNSNNKYFEDLKKFQNVVLSPHVAGWSFESKEKMAKVILEKIHQKFQTYIND